ncbi:hypothetical protein BH23GEM7_BH23GEM7_18200 [soil metagenome]
MRVSRTVVWLAALVAVLALVVAGIGLFWQDGAGAFTFTTVRGESVEVYGRGVYRYDSLFAGAGHRGTDLVSLVLGIPLLVLATLLYRRGSIRGGLLLSGALTYFLYVYATLSLGVAYNDLFIGYVAIFSASLFAFVLSFRAIQPLGSRFSERLPRRGIAAFLFAAGLLTLAVWLEAPVRSLLGREPPTLLAGYTTLVTHALDLAIIVPAVFLAGVLLLRRDARGYLIAFPLLVLIVMLVPVITAQTVSQLRAGISLTAAEVIGPIGGFLVLGTIAMWIVARLLLDVGRPAAEQPATMPGRPRKQRVRVGSA